MSTDGARPISVRGITKTFDGDPALDDVSLDVAAGEIVALLGPSGCGKTTLLRTIAGLEQPDRGEINIGGTTMVGPDTWVAPEKRHVGMVFQDWALFPHLSVADNVGYGLPRRHRGGPRIDEVLELVGLPGFGHRSPATLSGGQQQRVALARALAPRPAVLLLDEPFSNLDTGLRVVVRSEVYRLLVELGITTVFVTHDQDEAFVLGDRIAVMNHGRVVQIDRPTQLYDRPVDAWTASFVGSVNLVPGQADGNAATTLLGDIPLVDRRQGAVEVVVRPEDLALGPGDDGVVELVEYYGHDAKVLVHIDSTPIWVRTGPGHGHQRGERVALTYRGRPTTSFDA
ncbi:MAG: ABC transporter ATP-binding protein [Acidimicrobiia bacterium]|nr:ABC transporter ATP-binding protein [Acidimicrobiia bacterium]